MLIQFSLANFRSMKDEEVFSMEASPIKAQDECVDERNTFTLPGKRPLELLKTAVIYGANASGKSNLIAGLNFMRNYVINSSRESQAHDRISVQAFRLNSESRLAPSKFEAVFLYDGRRYKYGFEVDRRRVYAEWLFHTPAVKETLLFSRNLVDGEYEYHLSSRIRAEGEDLQRRTRDNALFLSVMAQFAGELSAGLVGWFLDLNIFGDWFDKSRSEFTSSWLDYDQKNMQILKNLLTDFDLGFVDFALEEADIPKNILRMLDTMDEELQEGFKERYGKSIMTIHEVWDEDEKVMGNVKFNLASQESAGTQKLFALAGPMLEVLHRGDTLVIDELDSHLHPLLTKAIINVFNSNESNPNNAQLIFTTHDTNLLDRRMLRRDQIWLTEKDHKGSTSLYSLVELNGVRNDADYEKGYMSGRYGAIPYINDPGNLWDAELEKV